MEAARVDRVARGRAALAVGVATGLRELAHEGARGAVDVDGAEELDLRAEIGFSTWRSRKYTPLWNVVGRAVGAHFTS
jgi:hypothetical protein